METNSIYEDVLLVGYASSGKKVLEELIRRRDRWGYRLTFCEYEPYPTAAFERLCKENSVEFCQFALNRAAMRKKLQEYSGKILVVSVGSKYLFPRAVVEKPNMDIINLHSALLPKYPGRNAPTWAIFCGETVSGPTWHWVNADVDAGGILWQGECMIGPDTKAYELSRRITERALEGFREIIDEVLSGTAVSHPQPASSGERRVYLSKEVPGEGRFSLDDEPDSIYRLLRSVDYGPKPVFPPVRTRLPDGRTVEILGYKKAPRETGKPCDERIRIPLSDSEELVLRWRAVVNEGIRGQANIREAVSPSSKIPTPKKTPQ